MERWSKRFRKSRQGRHSKGWRVAGIRWEYDGDGRFSPERIKGYMKRYWSKWKQALLERNLADE